MNFFEFFFQILATFKKGYLNVSKKFQTKAKRSLTWPLYGLFGLENPIISNGVYKKLAISNFNQIALVVPKLGAILENSSFYWGSTHSVPPSYMHTASSLWEGKIFPGRFIFQKCPLQAKNHISFNKYWWNVKKNSFLEGRLVEHI